MFLHLGICLSATSGANFLVQCGQGTRLSTGAGTLLSAVAGRSPRSTALAILLFFIAAINSSCCAFQLFSFFAFGGSYDFSTFFWSGSSLCLLVLNTLRGFCFPQPAACFLRTLSRKLRPHCRGLVENRFVKYRGGRKYLVALPLLFALCLLCFS